MASIRSAPAAILDDLGTAADVPALIRFGRNDIYGPSIGAVRRRLPAAKLELLDGCGHLPWRQAADRFHARLDNSTISCPISDGGPRAPDAMSDRCA